MNLLIFSNEQKNDQGEICGFIVQGLKYQNRKLPKFSRSTIPPSKFFSGYFLLLKKINETIRV